MNIDNATDYRYACPPRARALGPAPCAVALLLTPCRSRLCSLKISGFDASQHVDYLFSATNLLSQDVVLNGKQLDTSGQEVRFENQTVAPEAARASHRSVHLVPAFTCPRQPPPLHGVAATGDTIAVKALTYGFVFYPHANAAGCQ